MGKELKYDYKASSPLKEKKKFHFFQLPVKKEKKKKRIVAIVIFSTN